MPSATFVPSNRARDFGVEAACGNTPGTGTVNKFGSTTNADSAAPTDIWDGANGTSTIIWVAPTAARIHTLVSASDVDSDSGGSNPQAAGLRTLRVFYLPDWDTAETSEDVVMDGTAGVAMTNAAVMINRMFGLTWGANGTNTGIITATAATDSTITSMISAGKNQTLQAIYGVPSTQSIVITHTGADINRTVGGTVEGTGTLLVNTAADTDPDAYLTKHPFSFTEDVPWEEDFDPPKKYDGPLIAKIQVTVDTNNSTVNGHFNAYVVNK